MKFINLTITKVQLGGNSNNWKSLKRVYNHNWQTFLVNKKLGKNSSLKSLIYDQFKGTILYMVFNLLGRKFFYYTFYRKYKINK